MSLKDISYLELWQPLCSVEWNHLQHFGRMHHGEILCEIVLNLDQWFSRICRLKIFLIWSSDCPLVHQSGTICAILGNGNYEDQFCDFFQLGPAVQEGMPLKDISIRALAAPSFV